MESSPDLAAIMAAKSEDELLAVLIQPDDYLPDAPSAAVAELRKRSLSAEQTEVLQAILENREARSLELCPHCLTPAAFEVFTICAHCGQDKNAVRFPCPKCSATLEAPKISAGSLKQCSECKIAAPVPPDTAESLLLESAELKGLYEGNLDRLRAALMKSGLREPEWPLTLVELVNLPPEKLMGHLQSKKIDLTLARAGARAIEALGPPLKKQTDNAINKNIMSGGFLFALGLLMTVVSYSSATRSGGTYQIWIGAIVLGAIQFVLGLDQDRRRSRVAPAPNSETHHGPRCVNCSAPIEPGAKTCPQCGWTQPV